MARALGVCQFLAKKFDELRFDGQWEKSFSHPESNFSAVFYGESGHGKTEFVVMFGKYLTRFGTVFYNSYEQGHSKSLQDSFRRQKMEEVSGKIIVAHKEPWAEMVTRLKKKKSPDTVIIDSIQYAKVTYRMWLDLKSLFPRKRFLLISHGSGEKPSGYHARQIEFDADIKVLIRYCQAHPKSRFGGNEPFMIYEEGHARWMALKNRHGSKAVMPEQNKLPFTEPPKTE